MTIISDIAISLDGYGTGLGQSAEHPFGPAVGDRLHEWMFEEPELHAAEIEAIVDAKAFVMGRNMFSPHRGAHDPDWKGWWGDDPPYHQPVFVLTHHAREPLEMEGGTTFHFVTEGFDAAMARAREAAGDGNISIAGGVATINQALRAGVIDELRLHVVPLVLGEGERLFDGVGPLDLEAIGVPTGSARVTHRRYRVRTSSS